MAYNTANMLKLVLTFMCSKKLTNSYTLQCSVLYNFIETGVWLQCFWYVNAFSVLVVLQQ
jgi:hypothetical protein